MFHYIPIQKPMTGKNPILCCHWGWCVYEFKMCLLWRACCEGLGSEGPRPTFPACKNAKTQPQLVMRDQQSVTRNTHKEYIGVCEGNQSSVFRLVMVLKGREGERESSYVCVYIYTYIHTYSYVCIRMTMYTYVYVWVCIRMYTNEYVYIRMYTYVCIRMSMYIYTYV